MKINKLFTIATIIITMMIVAVNSNSYAQLDPSGIRTGTIKDIATHNLGKPSLNEVAETVGHNKISINIVWVMLSAFLVMFMQAGFAMVETGFTRAKNVAHTMGMNFLVYAIGMLGFWISGFAFMFGGVGSIAAIGGTPNLDKMISFELFG